MNEADREIVDHLNGAIYALQVIVDGLYTKRAGCKCDKTGLCAAHAQTADDIHRAQIELRQAIKNLEKER